MKTRHAFPLAAMGFSLVPISGMFLTMLTGNVAFVVGFAAMGIINAVLWGAEKLYNRRMSVLLETTTY